MPLEFADARRVGRPNTLQHLTACSACQREMLALRGHPCKSRRTGKARQFRRCASSRHVHVLPILTNSPTHQAERMCPVIKLPLRPKQDDLETEHRFGGRNLKLSTQGRTASQFPELKAFSLHGQFNNEQLTPRQPRPLAPCAPLEAQCNTLQSCRCRFHLRWRKERV